MTDDEAAEYTVLKMANDKGKFAVQVGTRMNTVADQFALERLQERGWVNLIDITPLAHGTTAMFRVFLASKAAMTWFRQQS